MVGVGPVGAPIPEALSLVVAVCPRDVRRGAAAAGGVVIGRIRNHLAEREGLGVSVEHRGILLTGKSAGEAAPEVNRNARPVGDRYREVEQQYDLGNARV